jgi:hypothetical protein
VRGFSEGKSDASKQAMTFRLSQNSNFFYTVLATVFYFIELMRFKIKTRYFSKNNTNND